MISLGLVDRGLIDEQLGAIAQLVTIAEDLSAPVWLRGGWAMDFFLGCVTREHSDIDWFTLAAGGPRIAAVLQQLGFEDVTSAAPGQQIDLLQGRIGHSLVLVRLGSAGEPLVGGGPWRVSRGRRTCSTDRWGGSATSRRG